MMGSIVVYHDSPEDGDDALKAVNRQKGMQFLGEAIKDNNLNNKNYKKALIDALDMVIKNSDYVVRYEYTVKVNDMPPQYEEKRRYIHLLNNGGDKVYELRKKNLKLKGYLNLDIERDDRVQQVFDMHVSIPRRSDDPKIWDYFKFLLADVGAQDTVENNDYIRAALTFSRCQ